MNVFFKLKTHKNKLIFAHNYSKDHYMLVKCGSVFNYLDYIEKKKFSFYLVEGKENGSSSN